MGIEQAINHLGKLRVATASGCRRTIADPGAVGKGVEAVGKLTNTTAYVQAATIILSLAGA
jgi:hypothetical protein